MEALYFLKFWKSTQHRDNPRPSSVTDYYEFEDEGDDSFFELELTVPDFDSNKCDHPSMATHINRFDSTIQNPHNSDPQFQPQSISLSSDKRKILPIESPNSNSNSSSLKPQSPISLLKSAPKFRVLMFKKSKSMVAHVDGDNGRTKKEESKLFTVKLKLNEVPILARDTSLRKQISEESLSEDSSRIFSKEVIQKYLKLIKIRVSGKQREKTKFAGDMSAASPSSSPATVRREKQGSIPAGIRVVCRQLGKSKSASAAAAGAPPSTVSRRDDSLVLQHDGIQSAILHCKNSFNSSSCRESSLLSTFASDALIDGQEES